MSHGCSSLLLAVWKPKVLCCECGDGDGSGGGGSSGIRGISFSCIIVDCSPDFPYYSEHKNVMQ